MGHGSRPRGGLKGKMLDPILPNRVNLKFRLSTDIESVQEEAMIPINLVQLSVLPSSMFDSEYLNDDTAQS